ncbi:MAG: thioester reductase domain-containing protein [Spirochaetales bacterium]|nr:thioester reductase domain-containing protein [Spirochaetales bacterium]
MEINRKELKEPWYQDAILDEKISPDDGIGTYQKQPEYILVTGTTGLVGSHLLSETIKQSDAKIFTLVRAENKEEGLKRIQQKLEEFLIWDNGYKNRIIPLTGDFQKDRLGLSEDEWELLAEQVDCIYHNGALINFLLPYQQLTPSNVKPTIELIKLAMTKKIKKINYISNVNVFNIADFKSKEIISEDHPLENMTSPLGYIKTKWVSDKLVQQAGKRGVPMSIYRLPYIGGDMHTGFINQKDFVWLIIKVCMKMNLAPDITEPFFIAPVDYISKAVVYISLKPESDGKLFSMMSPENLTWNDIFNTFNSLNYNIEIIDGERWRQAFLKFMESNSDRSLLPLQIVFRWGLPFKTPFFDNTHFTESLNGSGIECPLFSDMARIYDKYIRENELI